MHGTFETIDGRPALRFERRLAHPVERVWRALTEPEELAHWFPQSVELDLRVGGRMTFGGPHAGAFDGEITELDPPHLLAFRWGSDQLRFELEPLDGGAGCLLRLTDLIDARDKAARDAAGWHVCLDGLERRLAGGGALDQSAWEGLYEAYERRGLPTGAEIPGP